MLLKPRNLITSSTDVIIYEQGIIWVLSVSAVQWSPVKPVEWDAIQPQELIRNPKPLFVNTTVWWEISYEVLSFTEIKGKKPTLYGQFTWFLHFYFKWEIYESVIFSLHVSQTEGTLWKSALARWCVPYNLKVNAVCPFWAFCCIVPMEIVPGAFSISMLFMNLCRQENVHRKRNMF